MTEQLRFCSPCGDTRVFLMPPCQDGHDLDCLDLACVECGHAITVGVLIRDAVVRVEVQAA